MDPYDRQKTAEIWQRVRSQEPSGANDFGPLHNRIQQQAAQYQALSRQTGDVLLKKLAAEKQSQADTLGGIRTLLGSPSRPVPLPPPQKEPLSTSLRRCFGTEQELLRQLESHSSDCQFGSVFLVLVQQQRQHCKWLLEVLGRM